MARPSSSSEASQSCAKAVAASTRADIAGWHKGDGLANAAKTVRCPITELAGLGRDDGFAFRYETGLRRATVGVGSVANHDTDYPNPNCNRAKERFGEGTRSYAVGSG